MKDKIRMTVKHLRSKDSDQGKEIRRKIKVWCIKTCDAIYNLLMNAAPISMYNGALMKNT